MKITYPLVRNMDEITGDISSIANNVQKARLRSKLSKEDLSVEETTIDLDKIEELSNGRYEIQVNGVSVKCFINLGNNDRLYCFLSGAAHGDAIFHRWSWNNYHTSISIADPMYTVKHYNLAWYLGTKNIDYREVISKIIIKVARLLKINNNNIVVYGSSMGGTASLFISNYIKNSISVSINPQLDYTSWYAYKKIKTEMEYGDDINYRLNWRDTLLNGNKHLMLMSIRSEDDLKNIEKLSRFLNLEIKYGLQFKGNNFIWTYDSEYNLNKRTGTWGTHSSMENRELFTLLDNCVDEVIHRGQLDSYKVLAINEIWYAMSKQQFDYQIQET